MTTGVLPHLHIAYIIGIFMVATLSLQIRHKTMLIPLLCILAAHGATIKENTAKKIGLITMLGLVAINLLSVLF